MGPPAFFMFRLSFDKIIFTKLLGNDKIISGRQPNIKREKE